MREVTYDIKEKITELSHTATTSKMLALVSWNGAPAKLDLRTWREGETGEQIPGKGITLTLQEAAKLAEVLNLIIEQNEKN